jgi:membrane-bound lytic murein transglycosylase D
MRYPVFIFLAWIMLMACFYIPVSADSKPDARPPDVPGAGMEPIPSLVHSIRLPENLFFCDIRIPIEDPQVADELERQLLLALWNRPQVILWMKRAAQLFPHIQQILAEEQMPDDLKYVPVIESALRPHARSFADAVGYWQFLKPTGLRYGLQIDDHMDERRNVFKSTRAACHYLRKLTEEFGSIHLALAAYNMGEHGLAVEIDVQQTRNYFDLYLPLETQQYLPKMIAAKLILENPERYGFHLTSQDLYPVLRFDRLNVNLEEEVPLVIIARAAGISFKTLKEMNPDIRGYYLPPGPARLLVPEGHETDFHNRFSGLFNAWQNQTHTRIHVVKPGESLIGIAKAYNMSLAELLRFNKISYNKVIHPGDRLKVR